MSNLLLFYSFNVFCQYIERKPIIIQADESLPKELQEGLAGVKFGTIIQSDALEKFMIENTQNPEIKAFIGVFDYLKTEIRLSHVAITKQQNEEIKKLGKSTCDYVWIDINIGEFKSDFMAVGKMVGAFIEYGFCDKSYYRVMMPPISVNGNTNIEKKYKKEFTTRYFHAWDYNEKYKKKLIKNEIVISKEPFEEYLTKSDTLKYYEGVFKVLSSNVDVSQYEIGVYNKDGKIRIIYFSGADFSNDWSEGELKGILTPTMSNEDFLLEWFSADKQSLKGSLSFSNKNAFSIKTTNNNVMSEVKYIRIK